MVIYVANEAMRSKFKPIVVVSSESIRIQIYAKNMDWCI